MPASRRGMLEVGLGFQSLEGQEDFLFLYVDCE